MPAMTPMTVIKRNAQGAETFRYTGVLLSREPGRVALEASFNRSDRPFMGTILRYGDRFVEAYYTDRWYNILEIHDLQDDRIKGWYCNVGRPAVLETEDRLSYVDLALDLWVTPDGSQTVLDENEFADLELDAETRRQALLALEQLQVLFSRQGRASFVQENGFSWGLEGDRGEQA